ncbi:MAG: 6-phosphogluconolactonase [Saccharospirillaceae bacterium]|nr:6-phosphogluconolactonase [Saccharospirillaceae bacterium]MCD8531610.1 6-phosphogluconolactonase [Saccharospirillaceae bacterium]
MLSHIQDVRFGNSESLARRLAEDLATRLQRCIEHRGRACLAVSGGQTPVRFFQQLAQQTIDWQNVLITLVDERWVAEDDVRSNAALVREHLLQQHARQAYFLPLKNTAPTPQLGFMTCENTLHEQIDQLDFAVLGMGNDGHTASWFPHSRALTTCLDDQAGAWCCAVTDSCVIPPRMTLTWSLLASCRHLFLLFDGDDKNRVFRQACNEAEADNTAAMPVRRIVFQHKVPLSVYHREHSTGESYAPFTA